MKKYVIRFLPILILFLQSSFASAQQQEMMRMSFDGGFSMMLQEFSALLTEEDDKVSVRLRMGNQTEETKGDQLEQGDVILMINGKRASSIASLREVYDALEIDDEIKIGVQRGEERFILSSVKMEPKNSITMNSGGGQQLNTLSFGSGGDGSPVPIPELGLILSDVSKNIKVSSELEMMMPEELKDLEIKDYILVSINSEKPENAAEVPKIIENIETGENISLVFEKEGVQKSITISKPEALQNMIIKSQN